MLKILIYIVIWLVVLYVSYLIIKAGTKDLKAARKIRKKLKK